MVEIIDRGNETQKDDKFREKRKWQIALRRYVLQQQPSSFYAPYFGLDIPHMRQWIELQFDSDLSWENFSTTWQFDQVLPPAYFDFKVEDDLRLCWNFVNILISRTDQASSARPDVISARAYFRALFENTGYSVCGDMVKKIDELESKKLGQNEKLENFVRKKQDYLTQISGFSYHEFDQLNRGMSVEEILKEQAFLKKFK